MLSIENIFYLIQNMFNSSRNLFEFLSLTENISLKKPKNCEKCDFATKQSMFGVLAIVEILCYQGFPIPEYRTLSHPSGAPQRLCICPNCASGWLAPPVPHLRMYGGGGKDFWRTLAGKGERLSGAGGER